MFGTDSIVKVNGQLVRVIATDFSGSVEVLQWGCLVSDPDQSIWFYPSQVEEIR